MKLIKRLVTAGTFSIKKKSYIFHFNSTFCNKLVIISDYSKRIREKKNATNYTIRKNQPNFSLCGPRVSQTWFIFPALLL